MDEIKESCLPEIKKQIIVKGVITAISHSEGLSWVKIQKKNGNCVQAFAYDKKSYAYPVFFFASIGQSITAKGVFVDRTTKTFVAHFANTEPAQGELFQGTLPAIEDDGDPGDEPDLDGPPVFEDSPVDEEDPEEED